mmetsp:Transcript_99149/g.212451  ORF Transcript_99149/g.212451 Transcript_99149/m.212451 type:complete len:235 (+) Transcript_99149:1083-1787(+)
MVLPIRLPCFLERNLVPHETCEGGVVPGRFVSGQARRNVADGCQDGLAILILGEEAKGCSNHHHYDLLHLRDALREKCPRRGLILLLAELLFRAVLESEEEVEDDHEASPERNADPICPRKEVDQRLHQGQDVVRMRKGNALRWKAQLLAISVSLVTEKVLQLLQDDEDRAPSDEAADGWCGQEPDSEGEIANSNRNEHDAAKEGQEAGQMRAIIDVGPRLQLVRNDDGCDGAR